MAYVFKFNFRTINVEVDKIKKFFSISLCLIFYLSITIFWIMMYKLNNENIEAFFLKSCKFCFLIVDTHWAKTLLFYLRFTSWINFAGFLTFKLNEIKNNNFSNFSNFLRFDKFLFPLWLLMRETPWLWTRSSLYLTKLLFCCWKVS